VLLTGFRKRLRALPKAELHVHLDGSLRPDTMLELAAEAGVPLPASTPPELAGAMRASPTGDLRTYLEKFRITLSVLQTPSSLARAAYELAQDAHAENVRYLEVRYSPLLHQEGGMGLEAAVEAPLKGLAAAHATLGIRTGLILCGIRTQAPSTTMEVAELAVAWRGRGVVALDLAGAEAENPARDHREAFRYAVRNDLPTTVHAGEDEGAWSVAQALHDCHARRIGHGTRLGEDPELEGYVRDARIPLEVCLTSNVQTGVVEEVGRHPFRHYLEAGLVVTLNTDNRLISGIDLTHEYHLAHRELDSGWQELKEVALMGFEAAFLPQVEKATLLAQIRGEMEELEDPGEE
jgi:adenosine deaminase